MEDMRGDGEHTVAALYLSDDVREVCLPSWTLSPTRVGIMLKMEESVRKEVSKLF